MQSAGLLEAVSAAALRSRLKRYDTVETSIQCNFLELLNGAVSHVDIQGKGWESKAGLTARLLEVIMFEQTYLSDIVSTGFMCVHDQHSITFCVWQHGLAGTCHTNLHLSAVIQQCLCRAPSLVLSNKGLQVFRTHRYLQAVNKAIHAYRFPSAQLSWTLKLCFSGSVSC